MASKLKLKLKLSNLFFLREVAERFDLFNKTLNQLPKMTIYSPQDIAVFSNLIGSLLKVYEAIYYHYLILESLHFYSQSMSRVTA